MIRVLGVGLIVVNMIAAVALILIPAPQPHEEREVHQQQPTVASTTSVATSAPVLKEVSIDAAPTPVSEIEVPTAGVLPGDVPEDGVHIPVQKSGTVLATMQDYADSNAAFTFEGVEYPGIGFFVTTINGKQDGDGYYWMLYHNGTTADLGVSQLEVVPGDVVVWRFEEGY